MKGGKKMAFTLNEVDRVEILTLQDNYIDVAAFDGTDVVKRAMPLKDGEIKNSILAEHGFSAVVTVFVGGAPRSILFDFGFSPQGAAFNADALGLDLSNIEAMVLSHGHMDHFGGLLSLVEKVGKEGIELILHPKAFRKPRYLKVSETLKVGLPALPKEKIKDARVVLIESEKPRPLLDNRLLFLGEIPKKTDFEKGFPRMFYDEDGQSKWDPIEDDTAVAALVKGKGLIILSGCAHSGIVNTVKYAQEVTGIDKVYAVMGGFHLTGADFEPVIEPTTDALKALNPTYIIPTHCTGRKAVMHLEREMPDKFLLNMSGTRMVFAA
jgi:7,8-dihydropterin-6-yl-methyl-4-(beta-D-ribofuranosyl)aminobenzene 5'-phosphate synthase